MTEMCAQPRAQGVTDAEGERQEEDVEVGERGFGEMRGDDAAD